jgi:hypothetical protein
MKGIFNKKMIYKEMGLALYCFNVKKNIAAYTSTFLVVQKKV